MLKNAYLLAKIGADTAENEHKICRNFADRPPPGGEDGDAALRTGLLLKAALGWLRVRAPTECAASRGRVPGGSGRVFFQNPAQKRCCSFAKSVVSRIYFD